MKRLSILLTILLCTGCQLFTDLDGYYWIPDTDSNNDLGTESSDISVVDTNVDTVSSDTGATDSVGTENDSVFDTGMDTNTATESSAADSDAYTTTDSGSDTNIDTDSETDSATDDSTDTGVCVKDTILQEVECGRSGYLLQECVGGQWADKECIECQRELVFDDAGLEAAVREALGMPTGPIYKQHVSKLLSLSAGDRKIGNLGGIECLSSLIYLDLQYNSFTSLSELEKLPLLQELKLRGNWGVSDISPLGTLTALRHLDLYGLRTLSDISALSNLDMLLSLDLTGNSVSDLSPLSGLFSLSELRLELNNITDISPISDLLKLGTLTLDSNSVSSIEALSNMQKLSYLTLENNQITDLKPLLGLDELSYVAVSGNLYTCDATIDTLKSNIDYFYSNCR
ncbi:MAG: hypothetical protein JXR76_04740 [Deltaproteobacteria bacterium]|nr:hypothetical protein [Deltaproteobacteria bacterium]